LRNTIYVVTDKVEIGVLSLNSTSLKFLELKNSSNGPSILSMLLSCDVKLLVVFLRQNKLLDVYRIDFSTMSYVKLESLFDLALFFSKLKCHVLSNQGKWGYERNCVYNINSIHNVNCIHGVIIILVEICRFPRSHNFIVWIGVLKIYTMKFIILWFNNMLI
jgi:hypothetical protein